MEEHFNSEGHTFADKSVMAIDKIHSHKLISLHDTGKQVDQDPGDLISFANEPQDEFTVKLA